MFGISNSANDAVLDDPGREELAPLPSSDRSRWFWGSVALSALLGLVVFWKMVPVAGGAGPSGYMNFARLISDGAVKEKLRVPEGDAYDEIPRWFFQPLGFTPRGESGLLSPTYPSGLPLLLSLGGLHESEIAVKAVYATVAFLACLGIWYLGTELGLGKPWRFYAVAMLATSPLFLWSSLILMSDLLATCQAVWIVLLVLKASDSKKAALFCGVLLGWAVLTRPSSVLFFVPVWVALVQKRVSWRVWVLLGAGGLPALGLFLWLNDELYGGPLRSGYGDLWSLFRWEHGLPTAFHYLKTLLYALFVVVLPTAVLGLWEGGTARVRLLLAWSVPVFGFYAFYSFTSETWWFLRFVLVGVPALILLSASWFDGLGVRSKAARRNESWVVIGLVFLSSLSLIYWEGRLNLFGGQAFEWRYAKECSWANDNLEPGTLVVCMQPSGAIYYYTDLAVYRWDLAKRDADWERLSQAAAASSTPVVALLHEFEEQREDSILKRYPERWELFEEVTERVRAYRMK